MARLLHLELGRKVMKDQKKIRLGLIGVGNWALFAHVRVLRLLPEYDIVAIYSQRKEAAKAAAIGSTGTVRYTRDKSALQRNAASAKDIPVHFWLGAPCPICVARINVKDLS